MSVLTARRACPRGNLSAAAEVLAVLWFLTVLAWPQTVPDVTSVSVLQQSAPTGNLQIFILEISGSGLDAHDLRVLVFPAQGVQDLETLPVDAASAASTMRVRFTAPQNYLPEEVAISLPNSQFRVKSTGQASCDFDKHIKRVITVVQKDQAKDKYGNGIAANFHVVQLSIVNECPMAVNMPLAGIKIQPKTEPASNPLAPASLDHVTSLYSSDRKLTGARAIFFNSLQAVATLGSAIEPFFAHGFTQGVSIWGGGWTQAWQTIFKDMSAEQLQNITSQSLGSNDQIASNGPLQKFIFIPSQCGGPTFSHFKKKNCKKDPVEQALTGGAFDVEMQFVPASATAGKVTAQAAVAAKTKATK